MSKYSESLNSEEVRTEITQVPEDFLNHLYWTVGFLEKQNENIMNRGTALLGFSGIEIALILGRPNSTFGYFDILPTALLFATIGLFITAIWTKEGVFSHGDSFRSLLSMPLESQTLAMCQQILKFESPEKSLIDSTIALISYRGKWLKYGYRTLVMAQLSIALSVFWR